jgi:plastocyanin
MNTARTWILAAVLSLAPAPAVALSVMAGEFGSTSVAAAPPPKVVQVVIDKATFGETPSGVLVGDTIEWVNKDIFDHTATSKLGGWDVVVPAGKKVRVVMRKAGTFEYFCRYHPNMIGVVVTKRPKQDARTPGSQDPGV